MATSERLKGVCCLIESSAGVVDAGAVRVVSLQSLSYFLPLFLFLDYKTSFDDEMMNEVWVEIVTVGPPFDEGLSIGGGYDACYY